MVTRVSGESTAIPADAYRKDRQKVNNLPKPCNRDLSLPCQYLPNRQLAHIDFHTDRPAQFAFLAPFLGITRNVPLAFWFAVATQTIFFIKEGEENSHTVPPIDLADHRFLVSLE